MRVNDKNKNFARGLALKAVFLACALIVGIIERRIPFDFAVPGVKLGLANVVVLTALYIFPQRAALEISLLKCVMTAVFAGSVSSFFYSVGGAVLSFAVMAALIRLGREKISPVGVSVAGAVAHNIGQILAASVIMKTLLIATYLPVLLVSGVITGILVGILVNILLKFLRKHLSQLLRM